MTLDKVLTVAIGRNTSDGTPLVQRDWYNFQMRIKASLQRQGIVVAHANGDAVGSDGVNEGQDEDTAVFVLINPRDIDTLRLSVARIIARYGQGSAAFAYDTAHEPVFATPNGTRVA